MRHRIRIAAVVFAVVACNEGGVVSIDDRTGTVAGFAYIDSNLDGLFNSATEGPAAGVAAALLLDATGDTVARATTQADGSFVMQGIAVGRYRLAAARGTVGDTVDIVSIDSAAFSVAVSDTTALVIRLGLPSFTTAEVRLLEAGSRIAVEGIALNASATFADSTVHIVDGSGSIRAVRVQSAVAAGDSVRLIGTVGLRQGQPVIAGAVAVMLRAGVGVADADSISTATAAGAHNGDTDAGQVRIGGTVVASEALPNGDVALGVDDGSGRVDVLFDKDVLFAPGPYQPGALLRAAGVLVPTGSGTWQLKPRGAADVTATFPTVTIEAARGLTSGRTVYVHGIALNGWVTFGDASLHVIDMTGALRVVNLPSAAVFAGDSVRVLGTVGVHNGQPVLIGQGSAVLQSGIGLPVPDSISTAVAAVASGGARDAGQIAVSGTVSTVQTVAGNQVLTIDDGSGALSVVLDADVGFPAGGYQAGDVIRARGVLVPAANGVTWELKPRALGDVARTAP